MCLDCLFQGNCSRDRPRRTGAKLEQLHDRRETGSTACSSTCVRNACLGRCRRARELAQRRRFRSACGGCGRARYAGQACGLVSTAFGFVVRVSVGHMWPVVIFDRGWSVMCCRLRGLLPSAKTDSGLRSCSTPMGFLELPTSENFWFHAATAPIPVVDWLVRRAATFSWHQEVSGRRRS